MASVADTRAGRLAIAAAVAGAVAVLSGWCIYAVAMAKGLERVVRAGEGSFVYVVIAVVAALFGTTAFRVLLRWLEARARARALPRAKVVADQR